MLVVGYTEDGTRFDFKCTFPTLFSEHAFKWSCYERLVRFKVHLFNTIFCFGTFFHQISIKWSSKYSAARIPGVWKIQRCRLFSYSSTRYRGCNKINQGFTNWGFPSFHLSKFWLGADYKFAPFHIFSGSLGIKGSDLLAQAAKNVVGYNWWISCHLSNFFLETGSFNAKKLHEQCLCSMSISIESPSLQRKTFYLHVI